MRIFKNGNWSQGVKCPICNTSKKGEVVLIGMEGTEDGGNIQAAQVHLDCLELTIKKGENGNRDIIYQILVPKEGK
jgi:hypothetical protein